MELHNLKPGKGTADRKRVGRGSSSGHGKTSGRGSNGQGQRSGGKKAPGFEGGQTPLFKRLPKRGFTNIHENVYAIVNVEKLNAFKQGTLVNREALIEKGFIKKADELVKILGQGELKVELTVKANKFSKTAEKAIKKAGGKIEVI